MRLVGGREDPKGLWAYGVLQLQVEGTEGVWHSILKLNDVGEYSTSLRTGKSLTRQSAQASLPHATCTQDVLYISFMLPPFGTGCMCRMLLPFMCVTEECMKIQICRSC